MSKDFYCLYKNKKITTGIPICRYTWEKYRRRCFVGEFPKQRNDNCCLSIHEKCFSTACAECDDKFRCEFEILGEYYVSRIRL